MVGMNSNLLTHLPSLEDLTSADFPTLKAWDEKLAGSPPPKLYKSNLLRLHLGWMIQARQQQLKPGALRQRLLKKALQSNQSPALTYSPGTRLIREWRGQTHEVTVMESGYSYQGQHYRSLSSVAGDITGSHWSGPRFFRMGKGRAA